MSNQLDYTDPARRLARLLQTARAKGISDDAILTVIKAYGLEAAEFALSAKESKRMTKDITNKDSGDHFGGSRMPTVNSNTGGGRSGGNTRPMVDLPDGAIDHAVRVLNIPPAVWEAMQKTLDEKTLLYLLDTAMANAGRGDILDSATHPMWRTQL